MAALKHRDHFYLVRSPQDFLGQLGAPRAGQWKIVSDRRDANR
jgi:hypothetical protein